MRIDMHTHAFAQSIAAKAVETIVKACGFTPSTDGTLGEAVKLLEKSGIDKGVLLPVATKPSQQETINNWAAEVNGGRIISFGTVHPFSENAVDEVERVYSLGLKGIKFHNDYQGVYMMDEKCMPVYEKCEALGLPVVFHMGFDYISPDIHRAVPQDLPLLHSKFPKLKIIGAHMGGFSMWDIVLDKVAGTENVYLDTSCVSGRIDEKLYAEIIKKHGAHRILFGSDIPWSTPEAEIEALERLPLSEREKELIYEENAIELLNL